MPKPVDPILLEMFKIELKKLCDYFEEQNDTCVHLKIWEHQNPREHHINSFYDRPIRINLDLSFFDTISGCFTYKRNGSNTMCYPIFTMTMNKLQLLEGQHESLYKYIIANKINCYRNYIKLDDTGDSVYLAQAYPTGIEYFMIGTYKLLGNQIIV